VPISALWTEIGRTIDNLAKVEARGAAVDRELLLSKERGYKIRRGKLLAELNRVIKPYWPKRYGEFNPAPGAGHVPELMGRHRPTLPVLKRGKENASYDEGVLKEYIERRLDKRACSKLTFLSRSTTTRVYSLLFQ